MTQEKYIVTTYYKGKEQKLFKIEGEGMPAYFCKSWAETGRELARATEEEHHIIFENTRDMDKSMIMLCYCSAKVAGRQKHPSSGGLETKVQAGSHEHKKN